MIARMGKWLRDSMEQSYLSAFPPSGLLGAGGWPHPTTRVDQYFHPRFKAAVPVELMAKMFPEWDEWARHVAEVLGESMYPPHPTPLCPVFIRPPAASISTIEKAHSNRYNTFCHTVIMCMLVCMH